MVVLQLLHLATARESRRMLRGKSERQILLVQVPMSEWTLIDRCNKKTYVVPCFGARVIP
jgi:hypothetical protein